MLHVARLAILALSASLALYAEPKVVLYFDALPPEILTDQQMKTEFSALTEPLGLHTEWRTLPARSGKGELGRLIVVRLLGDCVTTSDAASVESGEPVASVQEVDGRILPFIDVHCDTLVSLVRPAWKDRTPYEKRRLLGRSLARVLAHEVYHVVGQTHDHAAEGITKARLNSGELTARAAQIAPRSFSAPAESPASTSDAASTDGR